MKEKVKQCIKAGSLRDFYNADCISTFLLLSDLLNNF